MNIVNIIGEKMVETNILIVEDDVESAVYIKEYLKDCAVEADIFSTATDAIFHIKFKKYDLILLDLNLPDFDGFEVLKFLNNEHHAIPVIVLSAYSNIDIKLKSFKLGAKDYIIKPIDLSELEARIWVHLGNNSKIKTPQEKKPFTVLDNEVYYKNISLNLTRTEYKLFCIFIENPNKIIKRETLAKVLSSKSTQRTLDGHIKNIRKKISKIPNNNQEIISTEYGMGYKLII